VKKETQITPPPPSQSVTSLDQQKISSETVGLAQRQQQQQQQQPPSPSTSPLTPPSTQPEATNEVEGEQPKATKKRSRKTTAKSSASVKRKKATTKKVEKLDESENEIKHRKEDDKLKEDESNSSLGVFDFTESDEESEDVDQLMPSRKSPSKKKSSVNNQKSTTKKTSSKKSSTDTKKTKSPWQPDEDKILIDKILGEMPSPSWSRISQSLKDRNANACLVRWKTLKKRLYQN
jgi:hypothetical protein